MDCAFQLPPGFEQLVHDAIVRHLESSPSAVGYIPSCDEIAQALQVALWASVRREEGHVLSFTINLRPSTIPSRVIPLQKAIEFGAAQLAKLSIATTPSVSAVHAGPGDGGLEIFGIDTVLGNASPVRIEVLGPATIAVKSANATVAFISGNKADLIDLDIYKRYFFLDTQLSAASQQGHEREQRFFDIARAMHQHGHGGTLLVLGSDAPDLRELIDSVEPHYLLAQAFDGLRDVEAEENDIFGAMQAAASGSEARALFARLRAAEFLHTQYISGLARTTAIDGAAVVSCEGSLLAFGCKVLLQNTPRVWVRRPSAAAAAMVELSDYGGTRHQSAARFVGKHQGSRAIVSSQDGKVSILNHAAGDVDCLEHAEWIF